MSSRQGEIEQRGERIFELVDRNPESIFTKAGFYQRIMAFSMRDEYFADMRNGPCRGCYGWRWMNSAASAR